MEEAMDDGWASTMIRRRDEECVRNANAPSCPLLEEGMSATCIGIDRYTDRRHEEGRICVWIATLLEVDQQSIWSWGAA